MQNALIAAEIAASSAPMRLEPVFSAGSSRKNPANLFLTLRVTSEWLMWQVCCLLLLGLALATNAQGVSTSDGVKQTAANVSGQGCDCEKQSNQVMTLALASVGTGKSSAAAAAQPTPTAREMSVVESRSERTLAERETATLRAVLIARGNLPTRLDAGRESIGLTDSTQSLWIERLHTDRSGNQFVLWRLRDGKKFRSGISRLTGSSAEDLVLGADGRTIQTSKVSVIVCFVNCIRESRCWKDCGEVRFKIKWALCALRACGTWKSLGCVINCGFGGR